MASRSVLVGPQYDLGLAKMILLSKPHKKHHHTHRQPVHQSSVRTPPSTLRIGTEPPSPSPPRRLQAYPPRTFIAGNYYELQVRRKRKPNSQLAEAVSRISKKMPLQHRSLRHFQASCPHSQQLQGIVGKLKELYSSRKNFERQNTAVYEDSPENQQNKALSSQRTSAVDVKSNLRDRLMLRRSEVRGGKKGERELKGRVRTEGRGYFDPWQSDTLITYDISDYTG